MGVATPNPVSTVQLSLPDGTVCCPQFQHRSEQTSKSKFPKALQQLLEDRTIPKKRCTSTSYIDCTVLKVTKKRKLFYFVLHCRYLHKRMQIGVSVNMDPSILERDYEVEAANTQDLRTHARYYWVQTPSRSLTGIVLSLLGKELPKDPSTPLSRWSAVLTGGQVMIHFCCLISITLYVLVRYILT